MAPQHDSYIILPTKATMRTRSKARAAPPPSPKHQENKSPSPDWEVDSQGKLRTPSEDRESPAEKELSPFVPTHSESPSPAPSGVSEHEGQEDEGTDPALSAVQSQNACSPPWLPWHDRALIMEAEKHRPFNAARGDASKNAWDTLAVELLKSSTLNGALINRTGAACRARFQKLVKAHKADETRSLQKTGTDEEVNEHIELLTQVVELIQAHELEKDERSTASRRKADVETKAALELRDAAMKGLVRRDHLTDVAQLAGASVREKQGQRNHKRKHDETTSDSDKENMSDADEKPKRKRGRNQLLEIVQKRNTADSKRLDKARQLDEKRYAETQQLQNRAIALQENLVAGMGQLTEGIGALVHAQATVAAAEAKRVEDRRYEESERRREEAERRAADAERYANLLQALVNRPN
ncbi:hypothetical protein C8F04DRAFT_1230408 [Mycena alexandri]|uniref:Myb-like domain-containing protein n=1 Tax=Mycena alexandri TaxID=1745969 RepID=A0AAD6TCB4_9AGAR|nr:hypothetical protein C8F04DRAFT_1230408 [Mycena alexandri]